MKNCRFYFLGLVVIFIAISCKKDDPGIDPENIPFEELSKKEQEIKLSDYMKHFAGHKYQLRYRIVFDESGNYVNQDEPDDCEKLIYIQMPELFNDEQFISQIAPNESCGISTHNSAYFSLQETYFANHKWGIQMFKILTNDGESNIVFNGLIDIQPESGEGDISDYLIVIETFQGDWEAAEKDRGQVKARTYREYTFKRID